MPYRGLESTFGDNDCDIGVVRLVFQSKPNLTLISRIKFRQPPALTAGQT